jgi:hypothetical protein
MSSRECPHADKVKVAHPLMLRAIAAAKRKTTERYVPEMRDRRNNPLNSGRLTLRGF